MTPLELKIWISVRGLTRDDAARLLCLSRDGLQKQLAGVRKVGQQTERITELLDYLGDGSHARLLEPKPKRRVKGSGRG